MAPGKPGTPSKTADVRGDIGQNVTFEWEPATDAGSGVDFYNVQLRTTEGGDIVVETTLPNIEYDTTCEFEKSGLGDGKYTIEVNAVDLATNEGESSSADVEVGAANAPQGLRQQEDTKFENRPVFQWEGPRVEIPSGIQTYQVAIADAGTPRDDLIFIDFTEPKFECPGSATCQVPTNRSETVTLELVDPLDDGNYRIAVRVFNGAGFPEPDSGIGFDVDTTPPGAPSNVSVSPSQDFDTTRVVTEVRTPVFAWDPSDGDPPPASGFSHYKVTILDGEGNEFLTGSVGSDTLDTEFSVADVDALPDDRYVAEVKAVDVADNESDPASVTFIVDLDPPAKPENVRSTSEDDDRTPDFAWDPSVDKGVGVEYYTVHIESLAVVDVPDAPGRAQLVSPGFSITDATPTFRWSAVEGLGGVTYTLEIASGEDTGFTQPVQAITSISDEVPATPEVEFTLPTANGLDAGSYIWRVTAVDALEKAGTPSAFRPLTTTAEPDEAPPAAPKLVFPADGTTVGVAAPVFRWKQADDDSGVTYTLEIDQATGDFTVPVEYSASGIPDTLVNGNGELVVQFAVPEDEALAAGDYQWRVSAKDGVGNQGEPSSPSTFTIGDDGESPPAPALESPGAGSEITDDAPSFEWSAVTDASGVTYELKVSTDSGEIFESSLVLSVDGLIDSSFDPADSIDLRPAEERGPQTFFWKVQAVDGAGNRSGFSDEGTFTLDSRAPAVPPELTVDLEALDPERRSGEYTPIFQWAFDADVAEYSLSLDGQEIQGASIDTDTVPGFARFTSADDLDFDKRHIFEVKTTDSFGNESVATLVFIDTTTGDDTETVTLSLEGAAPLLQGDYTVDVRAVDRLVAVLDDDEAKRAHLSESAVEPFVVTDLAISILPATLSRTRGQRANLRLEVSPNGLAVDEVNVSIVFDSRLDFNSVTENEIGGFTLSGVDAGNGTLEFRLTFPPGTKGELVTIQFQASRTGTAGVEFATGEGETEARFGGIRVPASLRPSTVRIRAPEPGVEVPVNEPPVAVAGPDREVNEGVSVTLSWQQISGPINLNLLGANSANPSFDAVDNGVFTFQLVVNDGEDDSEPDTVVVTVKNVAPTVDVGLDQTVPLGRAVNVLVTFTDPGALDTHSAIVNWGDGSPQETIDSVASGFLTQHTYADIDDFSVTVTVIDKDDGRGSDQLTVSVVEEVNQPPVANAGDDRTVNEGDLVVLDGSLSSDPDVGDSITSYSWSQVSGPPVQLNGASTVVPSFVAVDNGTFVFSLTVTDTEDLTGEDTVEITTRNVVPSVTAGEDQVANEGDIVRIEASFIEGEFADVPLLDTHVVSVDWGDESEDTIIDPAISPITAAHIYNDDVFTVTITVTDDDGGAGRATLTATISNVAPTVEGGPPQAALVGGSVSIATTFEDAGADDTHTAVIIWGDGTEEPGDVDEDGGGTVDASHEYSDSGEYIVTVTVTDDDDGFSSDTVQVIVVTPAPLPEGLEASDLQLRLGGRPLEAGVNVRAGEPVEARFRVTNITGNRVTGEVGVFVNFVSVDTPPEATFDVDLQGRARKAFRLPSRRPPLPAITRTESGIYVVQVGTELATFTIAEAKLGVFNLDVNPRTVGPGTLVEISAEVENEGGVEFTFPVDIRVDNDSAVGNVKLAAGGVSDVVRLVQIPDEPPPTGITSRRLHNVDVEGEKDFYLVVKPVLSVDIPTRYKFGPDTTTSVDADGNTLTLVVGGEIEIGGGSITLGIPVRARRGVKVASFIDTASGLSIIGRDVTIPLKDPVTGELLVTLRGRLKGELEGTGNSATGTFDNLKIETEEGRQDLSVDDPDVGSLGATVSVDLNSLPGAAKIEMTITKQLKDEERTKVELEVRDKEEGLRVANEAGVITVDAEGLVGDDVGAVEVSVKVSFSWILKFGSQNVRLAIVHTDGSVELVKATCSELPDANLDITCTGTTSGGFSEFSLLALAKDPANFTARNLVVNPEIVEPGDPVKITIDVLNDGADLDSFSAILQIKRPGAADFEPIRVRGITLEGGDQGTLRFFIPTGEQDKGVFEVDVEGLRGSYEVARFIALNDLTIANLAIQPGEVLPEEPVSITADLISSNPEERSTEIELRINNVLFQTQRVTVSSAQQEKVTFEFIPPSIGDYAVVLRDFRDVRGERAVAGDLVVAVPETPARFRLSALDITPLEVDPRADVDVTFDLSNDGEAPGLITIEVQVDGDVVETREDITVDGESTISVPFKITAPSEPGRHEMRIVGKVIEGERVVEDLTGTFRVIGPDVEPFVRIVRVTPIPGEVGPGQRITIAVDLINEFAVPASRTFVLKLDGEELETRDVTLDPGEERTETFEFNAPQEIGQHVIEIDGILRIFEVVPPIEIAVLNLIPPLTIIPREVQPDEAVTITAKLRNSGGEEGRTEVVLRINGAPEERKSVTVPGGQDVAVEFTVTRLDEGEYAVEVEALKAVDQRVLTGKFTVVAPAAILNLVPPLTVAPDEVEPGEPVSVAATLRNSGQAEGRTDVILRVNGQEEDRQSVTVPAGQDVIVQFSVTRTDEGEYTVEVEAVGAGDVKTLTGSFTVAVPKIVAPAKLVLLNLTVKPTKLDSGEPVTPTKVDSGEPVTISVDVRNDGGTKGFRTVAFFVDDKAVFVQEVTVEPGETVQVSFVHLERGIGTHVVTVAGLSEEFEVARPVSLGVTIPLIIIFALVVLGLGMLVIVKSRRGVGTAGGV